MKRVKVSLRGVVYGLKRVTVSLSVIYRGGEGVLLIALGLAEDGVRGVLDVVLTREEDVVRLNAKKE